MSSVNPSAGKAPLSLESCLQIWGKWERGYRVGPQPVRAAVWAPSAGKGEAKAVEMLSKSESFVAQHVSKAIEALPDRQWQMILEVEYVWHGAAPRVWRSNRLPREAIVLVEMLEEAKQALVPILNRRGIPV